MVAARSRSDRVVSAAGCQYTKKSWYQSSFHVRAPLIMIRDGLNELKSNRRKNSGANADFTAPMKPLSTETALPKFYARFSP